MKKVTGDRLTHEVEHTARSFFRNQKLDVHIGGTKAMTDGNFVYLPSIPAGDYDESEVACVRGFVDHEAAHGRYTDFSVTRGRSKYAKRFRSDKHFAALVNGMEDVRIESLTHEEFPGAKTNLAHTSAWANKQFLDIVAKHPDAGHDLGFVGPVAVTWFGRKMMGYDDPTIDECISHLSPDIAKKAEAAAKEAMGAESTREICNRAVRVLNRWGLGDDAKPKQPPGQQQQQQGQTPGKQQQQQQQTQPGEPPQQQQQAGDGDGDTEDADAPGSSSQADADVEGQEPDGPGDTRGAGEGPRSNEPLDPNLDNGLQKVLDGKANSGAYVAACAAYDEWITPKTQGSELADTFRANIVQAEHNDMYNIRRGQTAAHVNRSRRRLEQALQSKRDRVWRGGYEDGQLNSRALSRAMTGASDIFRKRDKADDLDTCILIAIDASSSMNGQEAVIAVQSCIAICEALEKVGVPVCVASYNTSAYNTYYKKTSHPMYRLRRDRYAGAPHAKHLQNARFNAISCFLHKDWSEPLRKARHQIAAYELGFDGSANADGDSLMMIYRKQLMSRPETKKIMIVMSDGKPVGDGDENKRLCDVTAFLESQDDMSLIGLGICTPVVQNFYTNHVVVNSLDELSTTAMDQIARILMGRRLRGLEAA